MTRIRVLVVDDSVVTRQVIVDALKADPALEVVGAAANGKVALGLLDSLKPDVITLDMEMPEMDGLATLEALRARRSTIPVIVFSAASERGARSTFDALSRGAYDYVCKPAGQRNITATMERIRAELVPKIVVHHRKAKTGSSMTMPPPLRPMASPSTPPPQRAAAMPSLAPPRMHVSHSMPPAASTNVSTLRAAPVAPGFADAIVIGVSTGGPTALCEVVWNLPRNLRAPVLIVQHMPPVFTRVLAQRLAEKCPLVVREAAHQDRVESGTVLIAPGDHHMRIAGSAREAWITLDQSPPQNGCRPAVDPLFESAARIYGSATLGVVMTGLGQDGTLGAQHIRHAGGAVWVQDEASCAAWGMPGSVVKAGLASRTVRLADLAREIGNAAGSNLVSTFQSVRPPPKRSA